MIMSARCVSAEERKAKAAKTNGKIMIVAPSTAVEAKASATMRCSGVPAAGFTALMTSW